MAMTDDSALIAAPCHGEQGAFAQLVGKYSPAMLRVAGSYVPSDAVAEEVVQETWIALVNGIATFTNLIPATKGTYRLKVSDGSLTSATTQSINVVA